jgi:stearoyl-CoA desaturase (delta-9 desaturase)
LWRFVASFSAAFCLALHLSFFTNSICHSSGSEKSSRCTARDVWIVGALNGGDGFHAHHHDVPSCARYGLGPGFQPDLNYLVVCAMERTGAIWNVRHPHKQK